MQLVVDTNVVIACLLKSGVTQEVFFNPDIELFSCDFLVNEIQDHKDELMEVSGYDAPTFELVLTLLLRHISLLPKEEYMTFISRAQELISDKDDVPFVAIGLKLRLPIWTHDKLLLKTQEIQTITTKKIIEELNSK